MMQAGGALKPLSLVAGSASCRSLRKQTAISPATVPNTDCR